MDGKEKKNPLFSLNVAADKIIQKVQDNATRVLKFLEALSGSAKAAKTIKMKKRGQDNYKRATPDGLVSCNCHGEVAIEIKCPHNLRNKSIIWGFDICNSLETTNSENVKSKQTHKTTHK